MHDVIVCSMCAVSLYAPPWRVLPQRAAREEEDGRVLGKEASGCPREQEGGS